MPEPEFRPTRREADPPSTLTAVIAVPVRNEAERIGPCLDAFAGQDGLGTGGLGVVLFLNNCTDDTARVVAARAPDLPFRLRVIERDCAGATAGWARREAMEAAAGWLEEEGAAGGIILTTDADCLAPADWVARNLAALAAGVEAVAGRIALDPVDAARLPASLHARGRLEGAYEALLVELEACIDPLPHDPWPRHWTTSGATLAVRLAAYRQVGGMPPLAVGEDRAFVSSLLSSDVRVRHDPGVLMVTSGRLDGRAPGGAADTMRLRCKVPESPCDPRLESLPLALVRFAWRRRLRRLHAAGRLSRTRLWAPWLGIRAAQAREVAELASLGAVLAAVEQVSPRLGYRPLRPSELPAQIRRARAVLAALRVAGRVFRWGRGLSAPEPAAGTAGPRPVERPGNA
ncbi:glycosyltransferase [Methylobacterium oryzisoli]|uniref:glycosyltransferase n=1 Tax=Methylobacterium oryzisoli TaxID=3385502 RepID=UPI003892854F